VEKVKLRVSLKKSRWAVLYYKVKGKDFSFLLRRGKKATNDVRGGKLKISQKTRERRTKNHISLKNIKRIGGKVGVRCSRSQGIRLEGERRIMGWWRVKQLTQANHRDEKGGHKKPSLCL